MRGLAALLGGFGTVLLLTALASPKAETDRATELQEGGSEGISNSHLQGDDHGDWGGGQLEQRKNYNFPKQVWTDGYQEQWPSWSGEPGRWVRLPPDPKPALPIDEEEEIPERPGFPKEERVIESEEGAVDITGVGEGTESVRAGLEGPWQGIVSSSRPSTRHEGGGLRDHPVTSSVAIRPYADEWIQRDDMEFPGALAHGNFPGVAVRALVLSWTYLWCFDCCER